MMTLANYTTEQASIIYVTGLVKYENWFQYG